MQADGHRGKTHNTAYYDDSIVGLICKCQAFNRQVENVVVVLFTLLKAPPLRLNMYASLDPRPDFEETSSASSSAFSY